MNGVTTSNSARFGALRPKTMFGPVFVALPLCRIASVPLDSSHARQSVGNVELTPISHGLATVATATRRSPATDANRLTKTIADIQDE